jgi:hypothetical protein
MRLARVWLGIGLVAAGVWPAMILLRVGEWLHRPADTSS